MWCERLDLCGFILWLTSQFHIFKIVLDGQHSAFLFPTHKACWTSWTYIYISYVVVICIYISYFVVVVVINVTLVVLVDEHSKSFS